MAVSGKAVAMVAVSLAAAAAGCTGYRAGAAFRAGNFEYLAGNYAGAIAHYSRATALDPGMVEAHFYLANSHQALAEAPDESGGGEEPASAQRSQREAQLRDHMEAAVREYEASLARNKASTEPLRRLEQQALIALARIHAAEGRRDPAKVGEYLKRLEPLLRPDASSAILLADLRQDVGQQDEAEAILRRAAEAHPRDAGLCRALAGVLAGPDLARSPRFEEAIQAYQTCAELEPGQTRGYVFLAMSFWSKAYRDVFLDDGVRVAYADKGLAYADQALSASADDFEAMTAKNLLLRTKARAVSNPALAEKLLAEADQLRERAIEARKTQAERMLHAP